MSKFYKPNVCIVVELPKEKESFINSNDYKLLQRSARKLGLNFKLQEAGTDNKSKKVLTIGRTLRAIVEDDDLELRAKRLDIHSSKVLSKEEMMEQDLGLKPLPTDLPVVEKEIRKFLNSLRGRSSWLAYLYWSEITIMFLKDVATSEG